MLYYKRKEAEETEMKQWMMILALVLTLAGTAKAQTAAESSGTSTNKLPAYAQGIQDLYGRGYILGGVLAGFGVDYEYARFGWAGVNFGFTMAPSSYPVTRYLYVLEPGIETGFYFLRNDPRKFRAGIGLSFSVYFVANQSVWQSVSTNSSSGVITGAFLDAEWRNLFLRVYLTYQPDASQPFVPYPMIGIKF